MVHSRRVTVARARPRASSSLAKLSMSARRTANSIRERTRHQVVNWRRSSAYASRVSPRYPARNPARASRSGSVKAGWIVTSAVDGAVVIGHLPAGLEPGRLGQFRPQQLKRKPTVSRPARSRYATSGRVSAVGVPPEKCSRPTRRGRQLGLVCHAPPAERPVLADAPGGTSFSQFRAELARAAPAADREDPTRRPGRRACRPAQTSCRARLGSRLGAGCAASPPGQPRPGRPDGTAAPPAHRGTGCRRWPRCCRLPGSRRALPRWCRFPSAGRRR